MKKIIVKTLRARFFDAYEDGKIAPSLNKGLTPPDPVAEYSPDDKDRLLLPTTANLGIVADGTDPLFPAKTAITVGVRG